MNFSIFRSKDSESNEYYPQDATLQSWVVNYPILAYKSVAPDDKEIVLVHLAHNMPQRSIHLGKYEFVSFVKGNYEAADSQKQIVLLVRDRKMNIFKTLIFFIQPWDYIDYSLEFEVPDKIHIVKTSKIKMPPSDQFLCKYSTDKIKNVFILADESKNFKEKVAALVIQF